METKLQNEETLMMQVKELGSGLEQQLEFVANLKNDLVMNKYFESASGI